MTRLPPEAFAACIGLDWADATHALCRQAAGSEPSECRPLAHQPDALKEWVRTWRPRFTGQPMAICLALTTGPLVSALRQPDCLVLFPLNPLTRARDREAFTPRQAQDAPPDAARQLELLLTHRDTLKPLQPQSPTMRAPAQRVASRRRLVGDTVRRTHRRTSPLKNDFPQALQWVHDNATTIFCDFLTPWPTLKAVPLARRSTLERFFRDHHGRSPDVIQHRIHASKSAPP